MDVTRRELLRAAVGLGAGLAGTGVLVARAAAGEPIGSPAQQGLQACQPAGDPLQHLLVGNRRFAKAWQEAARTADLQTRRRLFAGLTQGECFLDPQALAGGQKPWVAVLTCADSRVAPELLFGVTPGEMFDVRSAGNTAFDAGIASLEYAVAELGVPLIVVMGHSGCGAVKAAMASDPLTPLLDALVQPIRAVVQPGDSLSQAIRSNALAVARQIPGRSVVLQAAQRTGALKIHPLYFDVATGLVSAL